MITPFIPTKSDLASTKYTPAELVAAQELETYLFGLSANRGFLFLQALINAYRAGQTSVVYTFATNQEADYLNTVLGNPTGYFKYTTSRDGTELTVSWG